MTPLIHIKYPINKQLLLDAANKAYINADAYYNENLEKPWDSLLISKFNNNYISKIMNDLNVIAKPRFYWTEPNSVIPEHIDYNTTCSFNFVLSENPAPITFGNKEYMYEQCLLNTSIPHAVYNNQNERVILKLSIFNTTFEETAQKIPEKYRG